MPRKETSLPPLSLDALDKVERIESYAIQQILRCGRWPNFNTDKALRLLRTCASKSFDVQLGYYASRLTYSAVLEIANNTIESCVGLIKERAEIPEQVTIRLELWATLGLAVKTWKAQAQKRGKPSSASQAAPAGTVNEQSDEVVHTAARSTRPKRLSSTITSEEAARRLEEFLERSPIEKTDFAGKVGITPRTLLSFRRTGKIKRKTLILIAKEMNIEVEELTNPH